MKLEEREASLEIKLHAQHDANIPVAEERERDLMRQIREVEQENTTTSDVDDCVSCWCCVNCCVKLSAYKVFRSSTFLVSFLNIFLIFNRKDFFTGTFLPTIRSSKTSLLAWLLPRYLTFYNGYHTHTHTHTHTRVCSNKEFIHIFYKA